MYSAALNTSEYLIILYHYMMQLDIDVSPPAKIMTFRLGFDPCTMHNCLVFHVSC